MEVMPEVVIKYKKPETLKILNGLTKYFDIPRGKEKDKKITSLNSVTTIPRGTSINVEEPREAFSGRNINAAELRKAAWQQKNDLYKRDD